jgi:hypothetical protein
MAESTQGFDQWGIVEVMGHKKYAGHITEQVIGGSALVRVDVPECQVREKAVPAYSKLIGVGSIYMITPTSEEIARKSAQRLAFSEGDPLPVYIPEDRQLAAATVATEVDDDEGGGWDGNDEDDELARD